MHRIATIAALAAILTTTPGCAAMVVGYLVGDAIATDKRIEQCRANLKAINDQRIARNQDVYPDTCK